MQNHTKGIIYASITAFFWGFLPIALKVAVQEIEPITIVWFRFAVAFLMLAGWQLAKNPSSFKLLIKPPLLLVLTAIALSWNYFGYMLGIHYTTPSNAQLFIQTGPIMLAISGFVFFKEKVTRIQILGFAIAILGLTFFYHDQLSVFADSNGNYNIGVLITLTAALAWATYAALQKKLVSKYSTKSLNLFLFALPMIIYFPFINLSPLFNLSWLWLLLLFFLGANTFIAYTALAEALKYTDASIVSIIIIINPIITFITMGILTEMDVSWVAHEHFSMITILGASLVVAGIFLVARKSKKRKS
ncbi:MAG: EamA family transporter [Draconibacterium sp.]|nr:EamA family transporter [Draconibacterium sp.]